MHGRIPACILLTTLACGGVRAQAPTASARQALPVRINEINYEENWVEIFNGNDQPIDVSAFYLCTSPVYSQIRSLGIRSGDTAMEPQSFLVVDWDPNRNADGDPHSRDGEVAFYISMPFDDPGNLLDYVAFGAVQSDGRDPVAVAAGRWRAGDAVAAAPAGKTLSFFGEGATPAAHWRAGEPTPGEFNARVSTAVEGSDAAAETFRLTPAYPDPFNARTHFTLALARPQRVEIDVFDVLGRRVQRLYEGMLTSTAPHAFTLDGPAWPGGLYLIRVQGEDFSAGRAVMLIR